MQVRIRINPISRESYYEVEGTDEEILNLSEKTITALTALAEKFSALGFAEAHEKGGVGKLQPQSQKGILQESEITSEWFESQAGRPHLGDRARKLSLRDLIVLSIYVHGRPPIGKTVVSSKELYQFLIEDGFPVQYNGLLARLSESTRDGTLIRMGKEGYRLSRKAEARVEQILTGSGG